MNYERLELVSDFSALRAGMIVVVKPCTCLRAVRGMLVRFLRAGAISPAGGKCPPFDSWMYAPAHKCSGFLMEHVVSSRTVGERIVYRVVDGLDPEADREQEAIGDSVAAIHALVARRIAKVRP